MAHIVLLFSSAATANCLVAGIPAAARAAHQVVLGAQAGQCDIAVPGGWQPGEWLRSELARLAPATSFRFADADAIAPGPETIYISGEALFPAAEIRAALENPLALPRGMAKNPANIPDHRQQSEASRIADLKKAGNAILLATGKAGDGIVSRYVNRPVSRAMSRFLLRFPGITPLHATFGTAACAIAMALCLFQGGPAGLVPGALFYQAASIVDGVDGEIARATFRTSDRGAMLDSLIDAATNLAFIAGLAFNMWLQGEKLSAAAGVAGLVMLAGGLFLIGMRARASGGPFTFDGIKHHVQARRSTLMQWLTWITMRDFYAAAAAVAILAGFAAETLIVFLVGTTGWFIVTLSVLVSTSVKLRAG